jgi:hypothetical protein
MHDEQISERVRSAEYQSLLKKAFRNWAGTESKKKQEYIRHIHSNAATTRIVSDDVVSLFIESYIPHPDRAILVGRGPERSG